MARGSAISYDPQLIDRVPKADYKSQVTFLRLLSSYATQKVTYTCKNHKADLKFRGTGNTEFHQDHEAYNLISDSCGKASGEGKAVVEIITAKTSTMPIRDIATMESDDKEFGFEVSPVCFSA